MVTPRPKESADRRSQISDVRLLKIDDVADQLAVSVATVHRLAAAGLLPKRHIGGSTRFLRQDVDALILGLNTEEGRSDG